MSYRFEKSATKRAKETAIAAGLIGALFGGFSFYLINTASIDPAQFFGKLFGWLTLIVLVVMVLWSILLASKKDNWLIEVTDTVVLWQAPAGIGETSFRLAISEIERLICLQPTDQDSENRYILITRAHDKIQLKPTQSGVNIEKFIQSLADAGVAYEIKNQP